MARILIRPEDLARLAQRFDAVAEDLAGSSRRLARDRAEVGVNRADDAFPAAQFAERSRLVEANLRRLASEFQVDAALMGRTVDDAEFDGSEQWTAGLGAGGSVFTSDAPRSSWAAVAAGLASLERAGARMSTSDAGDVNEIRSVGVGGLFTASARGDIDAVFLDRLAQSLSPPRSEVEAGGADRDGAATGALWSRIVDGLFTAGNDSETGR